MQNIIRLRTFCFTNLSKWKWFSLLCLGMLLFSRLSWIHILWAKHFRKTKLNCRTRSADSIILSLTSICYNFFALLHNRYIVKEKMRHSIGCFSIRYDVSINKSKYLEAKIWLVVELPFSFRLDVQWTFTRGIDSTDEHFTEGSLKKSRWLERTLQSSLFHSIQNFIQYNIRHRFLHTFSQNKVYLVR